MNKFDKVALFTQLLLSDSCLDEEKIKVANLLICKYNLPLSCEQIISAHTKIIDEYYNGCEHMDPEELIPLCQYLLETCLSTNINMYVAIILSLNGDFCIPALTRLINYENGKIVGLGIDYNIGYFNIHILKVLLKNYKFDISSLIMHNSDRKILDDYIVELYGGESTKRAIK